MSTFPGDDEPVFTPSTEAVFGGLISWWATEKQIDPSGRLAKSSVETMVINSRRFDALISELGLLPTMVLVQLARSAEYDPASDEWVIECNRETLGQIVNGNSATTYLGKAQISNCLRLIKENGGLHVVPPRGRGRTQGGSTPTRIILNPYLFSTGVVGILKNSLDGESKNRPSMSGPSIEDTPPAPPRRSARSRSTAGPATDRRSTASPPPLPDRGVLAGQKTGSSWTVQEQPATYVMDEMNPSHDISAEVRQAIERELDKLGFFDWRTLLNTHDPANVAGWLIEVRKRELGSATRGSVVRERLKSGYDAPGVRPGVQFAVGADGLVTFAAQTEARSSTRRWSLARMQEVIEEADPAVAEQVLTRIRERQATEGDDRDTKARIALEELTAAGLITEDDTP